MEERKLMEDISNFLVPALGSSVIAVFGEESRLSAANEVLKTKLNLEPLV